MSASHGCLSAALAASLCVCISLAGCADLPVTSAARVDAAPSTQALKRLPRKAGDRVAVSIYEFRSALPEISARGTTDMFKTALVASGQFRVVERARVGEGVMREKQLNAAGVSTGASAQQPLRDAQYLFEGAITDATLNETQRSGAIGVAGAQIGGGTSRDAIGIDVRVVEVATGDIVDVISVRKNIAGDSVSFSGLSSLIATARSVAGRAVSPYTPDVRIDQQRREGVDRALRAAVDEAVAVLAQRFQP